MSSSYQGKMIKKSFSINFKCFCDLSVTWIVSFRQGIIVCWQLTLIWNINRIISLSYLNCTIPLNFLTLVNYFFKTLTYFTGERNCLTIYKELDTAWEHKSSLWVLFNVFGFSTVAFSAPFFTRIVASDYSVFDIFLDIDNIFLEQGSGGCG